MRNRLIRLGLVGALGLLAFTPATSEAGVCAPTFRPVCDAVCSRASSVCRLFG